MPDPNNDRDYDDQSLADDDLEALGYGDADADGKAAADARLDEGLKETFPASDPVAVKPGPG